MAINNFCNRFISDFSKQILEMFFLFLYSWMTTFSLALKELFPFLTSFTVCHAIHDCLSSTQFLILLIWPWMYSHCSFYLGFLKFLHVGICWVPLLSKDVTFILSCFFLTSRHSDGTLHLALDLVGMHSAAASMWALMKFTYLSFGVCASDIFWRVLNLFHTVTIYLLLIFLLVSENQSQHVILTVSYFCIDLCIFAVTILGLEDTLSKEEYAAQFTALSIYFLFMNICCPVGWGYKIHWLHLCWEVKTLPMRPPFSHEWQPMMLKDRILVVEQSFTRQSSGQVICNIPLWP